MPTILPTFQTVSSKYQFTISLEDKTYQLYFNWNTREQAWYMDISDTDGVLIQAGIKVVVGYYLLQQYKSNGLLPPGDFYVLDLQESPNAAGVGFSDFGVRYQMVYLTKEETINGVQ